MTYTVRRIYTDMRVTIYIYKYYSVIIIDLLIYNL